MHTPGNSWGNLNIKFSLPVFDFIYDGAPVSIDGPFLWASIKLDFEGGLPQPSSQRAIAAAETKSFAVMLEAKISDFEVTPKDQDGKPLQGAPLETRYKFEASAYKCHFSDRPYTPVNQATFIGYVERIQPNGWIVLKTTQRNPKGNKIRKVELLADPSTLDTAITGSQVLVIGRVCGKTPTGDSRIYVIPDRLLRL